MGHNCTILDLSLSERLHTSLLRLMVERSFEPVSILDMFITEDCNCDVIIASSAENAQET